MAKRVPVPVRLLASSELTPKNLGPLILLHPLLETMGIRKFVDRHCPPDPRREVSLGDVIQTLVANRLCSPEPLLHVAQWAEWAGTEFLLGPPAQALNDDRLGRALDRVFPHRWNILAELALSLAQRFHIGLSKLHYDPTSFHFTGEYDDSGPNPSFLPDPPPFKIEYGRHARKWGKVKEAQVGVNLAQDGKGPMPIFYHSADGSENGCLAVAKNFQHLLKHLKPKRLLLITDRGCFSAEQAVRIVREHGFDFISSLKWSEEYAGLYDKNRVRTGMREATFLSLKEHEKRRLEKPEETWEKYLIKEIPYRLRSPKPAEGSAEKPSIRMRLIFVQSTADAKVARKTREQHTRRIAEGLEKIRQGVEGGFHRDLQKVHKKVLELFANKRARSYFTYEVRPLTEGEMAACAPPERGKRNPVLEFAYRYHPEKAQQDATYDGVSVLGTSLSKKTHTADRVFTAHKEQHHIETAHHQWKAPIRLRPLFLQKPHRIESLLFVQFLALMAFYLLQRLYRQAKGETCRVTAETLIRGFKLCTIGVQEKDGLIEVEPFRPSESQAEILRVLGFPLPEDQIRKQVERPCP